MLVRKGLCFWSFILFFMAMNQTHADQLDIKFGDESAAMEYSAPMGAQGAGRSERNLGLLYTTNDDLVLHLGFEVINNLQSAQGVEVGLGVRGLVIQADDDAGSALGLSGRVRFTPAAASRVGLVLGITHAPNIVAFGDIDGYWGTQARIEYEILPRATAYVGYERVRLDIKRRDEVTLDESVGVGVQFKF